MMNDVDQMLIVAAVVVAGSIIGLATNTINFSDLMVLGILIGIVGLGVFFTKKGVLKSHFNQFTSNNSKTGINYSYSEGKEKIDDFANREFEGKINKKKGVNIDQFRSESEPAPVISDPTSMDFIYIRHYYVTHADKNQPLDFFVDVTNGEYFAHKQVNESRRNAGDRNPFEKLDAYRKTKDLIRRRSVQDTSKDFDANQVPPGIRMDIGHFDQGENSEQ